jgi:hypothetical protein
MRRPSKKGVGKTQAPPVDDDTICRAANEVLRGIPGVVPQAWRLPGGAWVEYTYAEEPHFEFHCPIPEGSGLDETERVLTTNLRKRVRRYLLTQRPKNYDKLPARKQWEIDKRLGLLDTEE